jgi:CBS domain-containing membrane protein
VSPAEPEPPPLRPRARWNVVRLPVLARRWGRNWAFGLFAFVSGCVSLGLVVLMADAAHQPLAVPSLGPTAFLIFDYPRRPSASPRNAVFGHAIGIGAGYLALLAFGVGRAPSALAGGLSTERAAAAGLSLGLTAGLMALLNLPHPPAAATTLIVSLGFVTRPVEFAALMGGVVIIVAEGFLLDRLVGLGYPLWRPTRARGGTPP